MPNVPLSPNADLEILQAVFEIMADLQVTPAVPYIPVAAGDTSVALVDEADLGKFTPAGVIRFYDETFDLTQESQLEEWIAIDSRWDGTNPIQCDFTDTGYTGFQRDHTTGTVGTNLFTGIPGDAETESMLHSGLPVIYVGITDERDTLPSGHVQEPVFQVYVEYRRWLSLPPDRPDMNKTVWALRQQHDAMIDLNKISNTIRGNPHLTTSAGDHATDLGNPYNPNQSRFTKIWRKIVVSSPEENTQEFAAAGQFPVRARWRRFRTVQG